MPEEDPAIASAGRDGCTDEPALAEQERLAAYLQTAQVVQAEEAAVGINVVIDPVDNPTLVSRETNGTFDTLLGGWSGSPAVDRNVYQFVATDGARNFGGYSNPRVDRILDEERATNDLARQKALYDAAFHILLADRPIIFLLHPTSYAVVSANVTGAQMFSDIQLRIAFARY